MISRVLRLTNAHMMINVGTADQVLVIASTIGSRAAFDTQASPTKVRAAGTSHMVTSVIFRHWPTMTAGTFDYASVLIQKFLLQRHITRALVHFHTFALSIAAGDTELDSALVASKLLLLRSTHLIAVSSRTSLEQLQIGGSKVQI